MINRGEVLGAVIILNCAEQCGVTLGPRMGHF